MTDDTTTFQQSQKPYRFDQLQQKIESLGPDPNEMSLEDLSAMVKDVRRQIRAEADAG
jgi:hypothetical protein